MYNACTVHGRHGSYLKLSCLILVAVDKRESAVVVVDERASPFVGIHHVLRLWNHDRLEVTLWHAVFIGADVPAHAIVHPGQLARLEHLALDTCLELLALARAGWALFAPLARVLTLLRLLAPTLPALALAVPAAQLVDVLPERSDAGLVAGLALARGVPGILDIGYWILDWDIVPLHVPLGVALALAAHALAVVGARAQLPVVTVAREVVALTVVAGDHLEIIYQDEWSEEQEMTQAVSHKCIEKRGQWHFAFD